MHAITTWVIVTNVTISSLLNIELFFFLSVQWIILGFFWQHGVSGESILIKELASR